MSTVKIVMRYVLAGEECSNVFHFWNPSVYASAVIMDEMAEAFDDTYVADFKACMVEAVTFDNLTVTAFDNPYIKEYGLGSQTGAIAAAPVDVLPVDLAANVKRSVGTSQDPVTGTPYTGNRPVRRGRFYLSGLEKGLMNGKALNAAAASYGAFITMLAQQQVALTTGGAVAWQPTVFGYPLPALPPSPTFPGGKAERGYLNAVITGASFVEFTKLGSRDST